MILIIGGSGFLGYYLHHNFIKNGQKVNSTYFKHRINEEYFHYLDVTDKKNIHTIIQKIKPDVIIYASAITNVDLCETDKNLAKAINVTGLKFTIDAAASFHSKIIYISTSAVFDGSKKSYSEAEKTNPISSYGLTKSMGEELVLNSNLPYLIIRTDQPYSWKKNWHHTNSVLRVIEHLNSNEEHLEISDWYNTPTYVPDFVACTQKLVNDDHTGIFHLVGSDFKNRFDFALIVADIFGLDKNKIKAINSSVLKLPAKRVNVKLENKKAFEKTGMAMSNSIDGLKKMRKIQPV
ncbi:SDR family oxidoreductase [Candidatus Nitrosopumilus sp. SW]|uniref:SDR family oxidoreductase n=1 Tax=Candidatus Nitrosopumilus sp. SW TaxID=2508726 RepID=UPI00114DF1A4|nr:SDR family oxidoreductase [Candidatus Nitrosopumilus sp. SW]QDI88772.1 SDR family oxidoreductase [Candidatus Nitrosopumilus sp. SW]